MDNLLTSVSVLRANKVTTHAGSRIAETALVVCALTLVADDQRSASRALIADFAVIVSDTTPELKKRSKSLVTCTNLRDHVLAYHRVDIPVKMVRHQGEPQFSGGKPFRMPRGETVPVLSTSGRSKLKHSA